MKELQIPKARKTQAAPRKFQHILRRSLRNFRQNIRTQSTEQLVANHLFNLPHYLHIYNNQGGKETIDTLFFGKDSDTWWNAVKNEHGRLANNIDNQVRATNTIKINQKGGSTHRLHSHISQFFV